MEMRLELVPVPVSDADKAKAFYLDQVGFDENVDVVVSGNSWLLQQFPSESPGVTRAPV